MYWPFRLLPTLALSAFVAAALGCAGGGSPATTPTSSDPNAPSHPALDTTVASTDPSQTGLPLYVAEGSIDWSTGAISLEPVVSRHLQLTEVANDRRLIDVSPFLNGSPCADCFKVSGLGMDPQGNVLADFTMRHPFANTDLRKDLDVFDPIAIFVTEGATVFNALERIDEDGNGSTDDRPTLNPNFIKGADGYTTRHDFLVRSLFPDKNYPGNLNPFVAFFTENNPSPTGVGSPIQWRKFAMGPAQDTKRVVFKRPTGTGIVQLNFLVVLSVNYAQSATFANGIENPQALGSRLNPVYFNPEFNMKEAYSVVTDPGTGLEAGNPASTTKVTVFVKDHQASAAVDPGYPNFPDYTNRAGLKWRSDLDTVKLSVPGVTNTLFNATRNDRVSGTGAEANPYRFEFTVTNDLNAPQGTYTGLVAVQDQYQTDSRSLLGFTPAEKYAHWVSYQTVDIQVNAPACPTPTAVAEANPTTASSGQDITFTSANSSVTGATIIEYSWDFDGVPPAEWTGPNPTPVDYAYTNTTGADVVRTATLTIRTNCGTQASDTVDVTIRGNQAPVASFTVTPSPANPNQDVSFDASASSDPDPGDSIVAYEWDFDYTAPNFDIEATGVTTVRAFPNSTSNPRVLTIALRVRDSFGAETITTRQLTINPLPPCVTPTARAGSSTTTAVSGQPISFFANLSTTNGPAQFTKYTWDWDIFDSEPPEEFFPVGGALPAVDHAYIYTAGGTRQFRARLTVYTSDSCFNSTSSAGDCGADFRCDIVVTIQSNFPPVAACNASPNPVVAGIQVQFSEAGSTDPDPGGSIVKYQWDWDDRDGINWTTPDYESTTQGGARHAYTNSSGIDETFKATLRVVDNLGVTTTCQVNMTVKPNNAPNAVADATPNPIPYSGIPVRLLDSGSSDPDPGDSLLYIWDIDASNGVDLNPATADYVSSTPDSVIHTYTNTTTSPVIKTATLRVRDQAGLTDDATVDITVNPPPPPPVITYDETRAAHVDNASYTYRIFSNSPKKDWSFIQQKVDEGGPWDFTDGTTWPSTMTTKIRRCDLASEITCVNFGNGTNIIYSTLDLNQYEGRRYGATEVHYTGVSDCGTNEVIYDTPLLIPYPETIGSPWNLFTTAEFMGFEMTINILVGRQQFGITKTFAGEFNALVEESTATLAISELGISTSQMEKAWVSDEGYLIADWLQELNSTTGDPTGKATGIVLSAYSIP